MERGFIREKMLRVAIKKLILVTRFAADRPFLISETAPAHKMWPWKERVKLHKHKATTLKRKVDCFCPIHPTIMNVNNIYFQQM